MKNISCFFLIYKCVGYWCWWLKIFNNKFHVSNLNILFTIQNNFSITISMYTLTPKLNSTFLSTHPVFNVCGLQFVIFYIWSSVHKHPHSLYPNCCLHFLVCSCVCLSVCLCRFFFQDQLSDLISFLFLNVLKVVFIMNEINTKFFYKIEMILKKNLAEFFFHQKRRSEKICSYWKGKYIFSILIICTILAFSNVIIIKYILIFLFFFLLLYFKSSFFTYLP